MDLNFSFGYEGTVQDEVHEEYKSETELQKVGREINELRATLDVINKAKQELADAQNAERLKVNGVKHEYETKIEALVTQMNALVAEMQKTVQEIQSAKWDKENEAHQTENKIKELEKLYAKLFESQDAQERARQLAEEIFELVGDWDSFQKARNYQKEVIFTAVDLYKNGKNGILNADDMGLGKTYETIISLGIIEKLFIKREGRAPRYLWLTRKNLVSSTPKEIMKWWPEKRVFPMASVGKKELREFVAKNAVKMDAILLTNYEAVRTTPLIANLDWDILIVDEVHKLKGGANAGGPTAIFTAVKELAHKAKFMFLLSGTPMVNSPMEMWSYLNIFSPEKFPNLKAFRRDYCAMSGVAGEYQLEVDPGKLLNGALKGQMVRRTMSEVGLEMPEFDIEERVLEMSDAQRKVYDDMRTKFFVWLDEQEGKSLNAGAIIAQLNYLRQINVMPAMLHSEGLNLDVSDSVKIDEAMDLIDDFADQCILSCTFNAPMYEIQRRCQAKGITCEVLTGSNNMQAGEFEQRFQQKKLQVFCMNIKMSAGMNLHKSPEDWPGGARYGITLDRWWSPADNEQFQRRIWRPGATQGVMIYDLWCEKSVDLFIENILEEKRKKIGSIADSSIIRPAGEWKNFLETLV